jgi:predicted porin
MKKHLIAAAVAAAVAVPAAAQVTISGRIDTAVSSTKNSSGQSATRMSATGLLTTPQIVISGSEDLGGGLKANFNATTGYNTDASTSLSFGGRGLTVGLSGGFGSIDLGKSTGTAMNSLQASGVTGDPGNIGTALARPNNSISYTTPAFSGISARIVHSLGDTEASAVKTNQFTEYSAQIVQGPLSVRVARSKVDNAASTEITAAGTTNIFGSTLSAAVSDTEIIETGASADYNAGFARFNFRYVKLDRSGTANDRTRLGLGAAVPIGNGLTLSVDRFSSNVKASDNSDFDQTSATVVKDLSKRTNVYAAFVSKDNKSGTDERLTGFGVRHAF